MITNTSHLDMYSLYQPTMNYYPQEDNSRRMSYSDYLSCSASSQGSFSDYDSSPLNGTEEYQPIAAGQQQKTYYPFEQQQQQQPGAHMLDYYRYECLVEYQKQQDLQHLMMMPSPIYNEYDFVSALSSPSCSTTTSCHTSPVIEQETLCGGGGGGKKKSTRVKRYAASASAANQDQAKNFPCLHDNCGKVFKRSEHLKRHVRSIHTREKRKLGDLIYNEVPYTNIRYLAYQCPYEQCGKRFSRSDNLSQHIRIHRTTKDRSSHLLAKKQKLSL